MIPPLIAVPGSPHAMLPPGIHPANMGEVAAAFATSPRRIRLFEGLVRAAKALSHAGCRRLYVDGSFTTAKRDPRDFDGRWDPTGVIVSRLDPVLLEFGDGRAAQKAEFLGELFIASFTNGRSGTFLDFFQIDRHTGAPKGIVQVTLTGASEAP